MGRLGSNLFQLLSSIRSFPESAHIEMISEGDEAAIALLYSITYIQNDGYFLVQNDIHIILQDTN